MNANALAERIRQELNDLNRALARIKEGWERARRSPERLGKLVLSTLEKFPQLNAELLAFVAFVESLSNQ